MKNLILFGLNSLLILFFLSSCNEKKREASISKTIQKKFESISQNPLIDLKFMTEEYKPYNYTEEKILKGISIDVLEEIRRRMGFPINREDVRVYPWARGYSLAQKTGKKNVLFAMVRSEKRENLFKWVGPFAYLKTVLFSSDGKIRDSLDDLTKQKIAVVRKDIGEIFLKERNFPKKYIVQMDNIQQMIKLMNRGKIKYFVYGENITWSELKKLNVDRSKFNVSMVFKKGEMYFAFNKSVADSVVESYQKTLNQVLLDKKFKAELDERYK